MQFFDVVRARRSIRKLAPRDVLERNIRERLTVAGRGDGETGGDCEFVREV